MQIEIDDAVYDNIAYLLDANIAPTEFPQVLFGLIEVLFEKNIINLDDIPQITQYSVGKPEYYEDE